MSYLTNFPNGISSNGSPVLGGSLPATMGNYYFVDATSGNDGDDGKSWDTAVKTIAQAYSLVVDGNDDVIVLSTYATHTLTEMLDITKSKVHFVGDGFGRLYGQAAKITLAGAVATDIHMIRNIGSRNTFSGIKFQPGNTAVQTTGGVGEGGEYTVYSNCSFEAAKLGTTGYCDVLLNGDSTHFINCSFGTTAAPVTGNYVRACVLCTAGGVAGGAASSHDVLFQNCKFFKHAGGTTTTFVTIGASADLSRGFMEFENCSFIANKTGSVPAVAIACTSSLTSGQVLLTGKTVAYNCTKIATATGVISALPAKAKVQAAMIGIQAT